VSKSSGAARLSETVPTPQDLAGGDLGPPLDLVHLARQCLGDRELEDELLRMFRRQARTLTAELSDPSLLSLESKAKIAHKLRGSALAVGARRVAGAAWRIEELAAAAGDRLPPDMNDRGEEARAVLALLIAVTEAVAEIERICG
jgi:HPt (histidine-containing phosphotransfer) domain-containing protein